jgi:hypothetical protein
MGQIEKGQPKFKIAKFKVKIAKIKNLGPDRNSPSEVRSVKM